MSGNAFRSGLCAFADGYTFSNRRGVIHAYEIHIGLVQQGRDGNAGSQGESSFASA
jgi:hypothetical protein